MSTQKKTFRINLFNTLYELVVTLKTTKRVPKYATVKPDTSWIYAGHRFKVIGVYMESNHHNPELGRNLELSLEGTKFQEEKGYKKTMIYECDLTLEY